MKKSIRAIAFVLLLSMLLSIAVSAQGDLNTAYYSYTYTEDYKETIKTPAPYTVEHTISGEDLGIGQFNSLSGVTYDPQSGCTYLVDSGNNRIVVLNTAFQLERILQNFENGEQMDTFHSPNTVFIRENRVYVSDTSAHRILVFDQTSYVLQRVIEQPEIKILGDYVFLPESFVVDLAGRIYVIVKNVNKGIVQLDAKGNFERFVGAPEVTLTYIEKLWRLLMNDTQKAQLERAVPTEYNAVKIDDKGFLYLTTQDATVLPITKLNCAGSDVLNVNTQYPPYGDSKYYESKGLKTTSTFVDIAVREDGVYAALDSSKGRIFVYDQDGVLLYCFGGIGNQSGLFQSPSSIAINGDTLIVVDQKDNLLTVFTETAFGKAVDSAVTLMLNGKYDESAENWNRVLEMCPSYNYAYKCLARSDIQAKAYKDALEKLKGDPSYDYYYKAFEEERKSFISKNFTWLFLGVFLAIALVIILCKLWKKHRLTERLNRYELVRELRYATHVMFHPFDGFWDLKREKRGSLRAANILVALFVLLYGARYQLSGYCFTHARFEDLNVLYGLLMMVLPLAMWIVSNWCFTSLMDGEGSFKDIYIATAYALAPYIITAIPMLLLSHCLSGNEAFIYNTFDSIIMFWMLALIFFGMQITHDYSLGKGILTGVLTLVGMCLMMFLALVCFNIGQDMISFVRDIYTEVSYRTY